MSRMLLGSFIVLIAAIIEGCVSGPGSSGWVTDPDHYWELSGFAVQAPSGPNWHKLEKNEKHENSVVFTNVEATPIRLNPRNPEFTFTLAMARGWPTGNRVPRVCDNGTVKNALLQILKKYQQQVGLVVQNSSYDTSLGADCVTYRGKPINTDVMGEYGVVRYESVIGYLCLHPDYDDFVVIMESRNGASVEIEPINRNHQTDHFFKSVRFTPRNLPADPAAPPSRNEGEQQPAD